MFPYRLTPSTKLDPSIEASDAGMETLERLELSPVNHPSSVYSFGPAERRVTHLMIEQGLEERDAFRKLHHGGYENSSRFRVAGGEG